MPRRLLRSATYLLAALCFICVVAWVRSYWYATFVGYDAEIGDTPVGWQYSVSLGAGSAGLSRKMETTNASYRRAGELRCYDNRIQPPTCGVVPATPSVPTDLLGLEYRVVAGDGYRYQYMTVPCWAPTAALAAMPVASLIGAFKGRLRRRRGGCPTCGYDLRATPDRCPECGRAAAV